MVRIESVPQAVELAMNQGLRAKGRTSPNPPVGAVLIDDRGEVVGVGRTQPVGGAHAEVMALRAAGPAARGATAVVTLEPCAHTGRTGPCTQALLDAGIARLIYVHSDPNPVASGGAEFLAERGVEVAHTAPVPGIEDALVPWLGATRLGRPHVTLKFAQTLDGFTAAADGTSQWITGEAARAAVHEDRARRDAILIGTGTALADNPSLTARRPDGTLCDTQPRRVVVGSRDIAAAGDATSNLQRLGAEQYPDIATALDSLWESGARDVLVEGGAGLASAFVEADLVDAIQAYIAPTLLGAGRGVLAHPVAQTLADAARFELAGIRQAGGDVLLELRRQRVR